MTGCRRCSASPMPRCSSNARAGSALGLVALAVQPLARLEIGEQRIEAGKQRQHHARRAFAIALALDVAFPAAGEEPPEIAVEAAESAAGQQILRMSRAVAVESLHHVVEIAIDVMQDRMGEPALGARQSELRMNRLVAPDLGTLGEQDRLRGDAVIGAPAIAHQAAADMVRDRHDEPSEGRRRQRLADLGRELRRRALVGIELEDPVAAAGFDAVIAAPALERPGAFDDLVGGGARDGRRPVGAAVEQDDDLVAESHRGEAGGEIRLLIMGDDEGGKAWHRPWCYPGWPRPARLASRAGPDSAPPSRHNMLAGEIGASYKPPWPLREAHEAAVRHRHPDR